MPKLKNMTFDELITIIKSLKKRIIVITGEMGAGKSAIALKIAETLDPSFNVANDINFYYDEFLVKDLQIKLSPALNFVSIDELNIFGLWLNSMYYFRNTKNIDVHVNILHQERSFQILNQYQIMIDFPSQMICKEFMFQKKNFLDQIKDGLKML